MARSRKPGPSYRGRFAPTPSGPLHAGSLMTALASWLDARKAGGAWLLRIDDLDSARCQQRHTDTILKQLEGHGLHWDEAPVYQSRQARHYRAALEQLQEAGHLYPCACTRAILKRDSRPGPDGPVYNGHCRALSGTVNAARAATRMRVPPQLITLNDGLQGSLERSTEKDIGDFVVRRADHVIGYQLACAVDEHNMRITDVVRGADLIGSTFCQWIVQDTLRLRVPAYHHLPLALDAQGRKLSKQNHSPSIKTHLASPNLFIALQGLGQQPPATLYREAPRTVLAWALIHWQPQAIARVAMLRHDDCVQNTARTANLPGVEPQ